LKMCSDFYRIHGFQGAALGAAVIALRTILNAVTPAPGFRRDRVAGVQVFEGT
jgi:hypothetical protein